MDWDECTEIESTVASLIWIHKFQECRGERLTNWVSTFHPDKLSCHIAGDSILDDRRGSFNLICKVLFTNKEAWAVRFPFGGKVKLPDEKLAAEVATMNFIRHQTDIPVPEVKAWGLAADNELGIGPFIMTSFIEGVNLGDVLRSPTDGDRLMREDVSDEAIKTVYRQVARILLQLSRLDFARIGSLSPVPQRNDDGDTAVIKSRPVTLKAHEILNVGGVDVFCSPAMTFSSTADYFNYVADQDLQHLTRQLNSVDDMADAREKYICWNVVRKLVKRFTSPKHDHGPFKLICDDFGPANMIVNNAQDLEITAVIDWEWSYAGPQELFWSPPRWLVMQTPNMWTRADDRLVRYNKYLDIYIQVMKDQEAKLLGGEVDVENRPSTFLQKCKEDGSMWFYQILREGFNGPTHVPFKQLRKAVSDFDEIANAISNEEIDAFIRMKTGHLQRYDHLIQKKKEWRERLQTGEEELPALQW